MAKKPTLTSRDQEILSHIHRFRISTPEVLHRLFFPGAAPNAVTKVLSRLRRAGLLSQHDLYQTRKYWMLTPQAASRFGELPSSTKPLGPQALTDRFGVLAFCCRGEELRHKITATEFRERFPELYSPRFRTASYFVEQRGSQSSLGVVHVDHGADHLRVLRKALRQTQERIEIPAFRKVINDGRFSIAIVTAYDEKKLKLEHALEEREPLAARYHVETVPELAHLVGVPHVPT